jgi:hypothetical protein
MLSDDVLGRSPHLCWSFALSMPFISPETVSQSRLPQRRHILRTPTLVHDVFKVHGTDVYSEYASSISLRYISEGYAHTNKGTCRHRRQVV